MAKTIQAYFQPQAWINNYAIDVDGACHVDVTQKILDMSLNDIKQLRDNRDETDELVDLKELGHTGPFYVTVTNAICKFFGVDSLSEITKRMLDKARVKHHSGNN